MEFINEDVYNGDWENDKMDGVGTMNYSSDNEKNYLSYSGDWEDNKRSGAGSLLFTDGRFYEGNWEEDQPLCDDYPETYISGDWGDETWKCVDPDFRDSLDADAAEDAADEDDEDLNVALEIHRKSGKINLEKYLEIIDMDKSNSAKYGDVVSYIRPKFEGFIKENFQTEEQPLALLKITEILDKLSSAREVSAKPENVKIIGKTIDFVFRQPKEFVNFYIAFDYKKLSAIMVF
jgi:hypothetical protein